jgi:hypothetical protein
LLPASALRAQAQQDGAAQEKKAAEQKDPKKKEDKGGFLGIGGKKDEDTKAAEQAQKYQELREKAWTKYKDPAKPDFKMRVHADYKEKRREHSEYAFQINTFNANDERITYTGDKLTTEDTLYDNHLVQDYVNRVGQSLVPDASQHRYAFKVVLNPVPDARSLSTGTVYITTGLLSLIDTEAQLAYILAHEIAHIESNHWMEDALVLNELVDRQRARDKTFKWISVGAAVATGGLSMAQGGGAFNSLFTGGILGYGTYALLKFVSSIKTFAWDNVQEDDADKLGLKLMFDRNYDPREAPKLYARLRTLAEREPRVSDGFMARAERVSERVGYVNPMMAPWQAKKDMARGSSNLRGKRQADSDDAALLSPLEAGKPFGPADDAEKREKAASKGLRNMDAELRAKLDRGEIIGSGPEFDTVMADLKRDNGVRAFYYDMFSMALQNLREAQQIRSDDPYTAFYYGKVLQLVARKPAEKAEAMQAFINASNLDKRGVLPGPWLHRALGLMADRNPSQRDEIIGHLRRYVDVYQQEHSGALPPNMDAIYEYLKTLGDDTWAARPVQNVSTRNIDPLEVAAPRPAAPVRVSQQEPPENTAPANTTPANSTPANKGGGKTKPGKP